MTINQSLARVEDHLGPEQDKFSNAYVKHLQQNLKFHPRIQKRVYKALKKVAEGMKKNPKEDNYNATFEALQTIQDAKGKA